MNMMVMVNFSLTKRIRGATQRTREPLPCEIPTPEEIASIPCIPMPHDKSLLEIMGIKPESIADEYCRIINTYLKGHMKEQEKRSRIERLGRL